MEASRFLSRFGTIRNTFSNQEVSMGATCSVNERCYYDRINCNCQFNKSEFALDRFNLYARWLKIVQLFGAETSSSFKEHKPNYFARHITFHRMQCKSKA